MRTEQSRRVLVVDDDQSVRRMLAAVLRQQGLFVDEADGGAAAIECLSNGGGYAVILLDLLMPELDGFAVLRQLAILDPQPAPVVLVLTGADARTIDRLDSQRIHGIVRKPFDAAEIASLVAACSEIRGRSSLETMAIAMMSSAPLLALLNGPKLS